MFQRPPPSSATTSRLTTSFNYIAQHDFLFIESHGEQGAAASAGVPLRVGKKDMWQHVIDNVLDFR
eukprot:1286650-Prorocentrum_lima.AAC.1